MAKKQGKVRYVLGFAFSPDLRSVVMVRKMRPAWQRGFLNGVGGVVDWIGAEPYNQAMLRTFAEETTVRPDDKQLIDLGRMQGSDWEVTLYCARLERAQNMRTPPDDPTAEQVEVWPWDKLPQNCVPGVRWLVPLAYARLLGERENANGYQLSYVAAEYKKIEEPRHPNA